MLLKNKVLNLTSLYIDIKNLITVFKNQKSIKKSNTYVSNKFDVKKSNVNIKNGQSKIYNLENDISIVADYLIKSKIDYKKITKKELDELNLYSNSKFYKKIIMTAYDLIKNLNEMDSSKGNLKELPQKLKNKLKKLL